MADAVKRFLDSVAERGIRLDVRMMGQSTHTAADAAADTVNYNGSDTLSFCHALDTKNYSTK